MNLKFENNWGQGTSQFVIIRSCRLLTHIANWSKIDANYSESLTVKFSRQNLTLLGQESNKGALKDQLPRELGVGYSSWWVDTAFKQELEAKDEKNEIIIP